MSRYYVPLPTAAGEKARAFVPNPLPPVPPLELDTEIQELVEKAMLALGRLDGLTTVLPDPAILFYSYVRKEAVLSSQIEGTQTAKFDTLCRSYERQLELLTEYRAALIHDASPASAPFLPRSPAHDRRPRSAAFTPLRRENRRARPDCPSASLPSSVEAG